MLSKINKIYITIIVAFVLAFITTGSYGQCTYTTYSLSPSGNICGTATTLTLSGSQVGVTYQLQSGSGTMFSTVSGTGSALTWSNITLDGGNSYAVTASKNGCTNTVVVASTYVNGIAPITAADVMITANKSVLYPGDSITFTVNRISNPNNPQLTITSYQLFDGSSISTSTANTFTVKTQAAHASTYSILVNANCGSAMVNCPAFAIPGQLLSIATTPPTSATNQNYTAIVTTAAPMSSVPNNVSISDALLSIEYDDGLGRPIETTVKGASPSMLDQIAFHMYDATGRETQQYLPFTGNSGGSFIPVTTAQPMQTSFYQGVYSGEGNFFAKTDYENTPLNRPVKVYGAGNNFVGNSKGIATQYLVNSTAENVRIWNIAATQGALPTSSGAYATGKLYKTITTNEQGIQNIEYKNTDGQVILKKVKLTASADAGTSAGSTHSGFLCTYYVYDDYGNLRFVIPPLVVKAMDDANNWTVTQAQANNLCYRTEYDLFNRAIIVKNPGIGEKWLVYDQRGRLVMSQDSSLRMQKKWAYFQYDNLDRTIATGLMTDPTYYNNLAYHQNLAVNSTAYPAIANYTTEQLTQTYYDNYSWAAGVGLSATIDASQASNSTYFYAASNAAYPYPQSIAQTALTRGLQTGSKVEILEKKGTYLYSEVFYDSKARPVQTQQINITGSVDKSTNQFSWSGLLLRNLVQHTYKGTAGTQTHIVLTKDNYDAVGRLLTVTKTIFSTLANGTKINSAEKTIASYSYDELGRVKTENLGTKSGTTNPLETRQYDYNIRSWLLGINRAYVQTTASTTTAPNTGEQFTTPNALSAGNYFGFELGYDKNPSVAGAAWTNLLYSGNTTGTIWKLANDGEIRKYDYTYDNAGRLNGADFNQYTSGFNKTAGVDYSVSNIGYDYNGNLLSMTQKGLTSAIATSSPVIDQLTYSYGTSSNQLTSVSDAVNGSTPALGATGYLGDFHYASGASSGATYTYDGNGNLITDGNKGISAIKYNLLNLPDTVQAGKGSIRFIYDAAGNKLQKIITEGSKITTLYYMAGFEYQNDTMLFAAHEQGRARINTSNTYVFDYYLTDHLGNVRMVLSDDAGLSTPIIEANSYYPMGLAMTMLNKTVNLSTHSYYGYQGKEMQNKEFSDGSGLEAYDFKARFYDQQLGVWHNPDPAGQFASPYLAMGNNWANGIDPDGRNFWKWAWNFFVKSSWNGVKISAGAFAWNDHKTVGGNFLEVLSRITWQGPQQTVGSFAAETQNLLGLVNKVGYFDGATVLNTNWLKNADPPYSASAFTIGSYINGPSEMKADPSDPTFQHEYGRYLQSQADGFSYLTFTAIPDLLRSGNDNPTAWDGNARAFKYFNEYYGGVYTDIGNPTGNVYWDLTNNPIPGYIYNSKVDDPVNQAALKSAMRHPNMFDIFAGATFGAIFNATPLSAFWFIDTGINYSKN